MLMQNERSTLRRAKSCRVNDIHARLNPTDVDGILRPETIGDVQAAVHDANRRDQTICIAGGRHAMGGQQFAENALLIDMTGFDRVLSLDSERGLVEVQSGIVWPQLIDALATMQSGSERHWGIRQKQTGADRLSIGGSLAANVHGRGLRFPPIVADVESFVLVDAEGSARTCSRSENAELFSLAIGGYGLFGIIAHVTLRLDIRRKLERVVRLLDVDDLMGQFSARMEDGYLFGDLQYATDPESDVFLKQGVFSCYRPVDPATPMPETCVELDEGDWRALIRLAHTDRRRAFEVYSDFYLRTSGQLYWSDTNQLSTYLDDYHQQLDADLGTAHPGSEMITEAYVLRDSLDDFLNVVRDEFRAHDVDLIYGTIRLIERDVDTFLAWAREPWVCVIFNLHTDHTPTALEKTKRDFRRLIDRAIEFEGSYFLTYHRWATREQVLTCYPQFIDFLRLKRKYDPCERFQSTWYRHYRDEILLGG